MIMNRKTVWLAFIASLVLVVASLAACGADIPDDVAPTEPPPAESEASADGNSVDDVETNNDVTEFFEDVAESGETSSETTEIALADTEVDANGVPIGFTDNGNPYRGNPNAPVVIEEFSDFQ